MNSYKEYTKVFKGFSDETRLAILCLLQQGEKCACKLLEELHISQSTLSHHMKILCDAGIVVARKEGKWSYYSINEDGVIWAMKILSDFTKVNSKALDNCI